MNSNALRTVNCNVSNQNSNIKRHTKDKLGLKDSPKRLIFSLTLSIIGRPVHSCCQTTYCGTSCLLCRWRSCLELSSCGRHFSTFPTHFLKTFKTASPHSPILALSSKLSFSHCMVFVVAVCYLGTLKWLIDWLIDPQIILQLEIRSMERCICPIATLALHLTLYSLTGSRFDP